MEEDDIDYSDDLDEPSEPQPLERQSSVSNYFSPCPLASAVPISSVRRSLDPNPRPAPIVPYSARHTLDILEARNSPLWEDIGYRHPAAPRVSPRFRSSEQPVLPLQTFNRRPFKRARCHSATESSTGIFVHDPHPPTPATLSRQLLTIATCPTSSLTYRILAGEDIADATPRELSLTIGTLQQYLRQATELGMTDEMAHLGRSIRMASRQLTERPEMAQRARNGRVPQNTVLRSPQFRPLGH
jgi:hypothetical protein